MLIYAESLFITLPFMLSLSHPRNNPAATDGSYIQKGAAQG